MTLCTSFFTYLFTNKYVKTIFQSYAAEDKVSQLSSFGVYQSQRWKVQGFYEIACGIIIIIMLECGYSQINKVEFSILLFLESLSLHHNNLFKQI